MNDWLVGIQHWYNPEARPREGISKTVFFSDIQGRFYDPKRSNFGKPHASATGVYIEGLVDAYRMAVEAGAEQQRKSYARSLKRAMHSVTQLQFQDAADMYYVRSEDRWRVRGGLRTQVYHNEIRNDKVQHVIMGSIKVLEAFAEFGQSWQ